MHKIIIGFYLLLSISSVFAIEEINELIGYKNKFSSTKLYSLAHEIIDQYDEEAIRKYVLKKHTNHVKNDYAINVYIDKENPNFKQALIAGIVFPNDFERAGKTLKTSYYDKNIEGLFLATKENHPMAFYWFAKAMKMYATFDNKHQYTFEGENHPIIDYALNNAPKYILGAGEDYNKKHFILKDDYIVYRLHSGTDLSQDAIKKDILEVHYNNNHFTWIWYFNQAPFNDI